jgi:hypothetical protein
MHGMNRTSGTFLDGGPTIARTIGPTIGPIIGPITGVMT